MGIRQEQMEIFIMLKNYPSRQSDQDQMQSNRGQMGLHALEEVLPGSGL